MSQAPALVLEHPVGGAFEEVFGTEWTPTGGQLFLTSNGGRPAASALFEMGNEVRIGEWVHVQIELSLTAEKFSRW